MFNTHYKNYHFILAIINRNLFQDDKYSWDWNKVPYEDLTDYQKGRLFGLETAHGLALDNRFAGKNGFTLKSPVEALAKFIKTLHQENPASGKSPEFIRGFDECLEISDALPQIDKQYPEAA